VSCSDVCELCNIQGFKSCSLFRGSKAVSCLKVQNLCGFGSCVLFSGLGIVPYSEVWKLFSM
jgi:hypothetical protein